LNIIQLIELNGFFHILSKKIAVEKRSLFKVDSG